MTERVPAQVRRSPMDAHRDCCPTAACVCSRRRAHDCRRLSRDVALRSDLTQPERDQHQVRAMAIRTESRITIAGSVPEVWAYVCDVGRWPEWAPTVLECRVRG